MVMKRVLGFLILAWGSAALPAGCGKDPEAAPIPKPAELPLQTLGGFEYKEKMKLPEEVVRWNGRRVRATGFMNPTTQARNLTTFLLVKDRASCCFGKRPQINHYVEVKLKAGATANYSTDPVTVEGVLTVEDRWDGDWQLGLYWMEGAEVVK
jgi:hypothetical protein